MSKEGIESKEDLVEKEIGERLAGHNDSTTGAMVSRDLLTKLSTEERIALAGEVARARYKEKNSITEVYRNAAYLANPLIMQIVRDNGYPASKEDLEAFFKLGEKANAGNEGAKKSLIEYLDKVPPQMVQALMPMYHDFLNDVGEETKEEAIKKISGLAAERRTKILSNLGVKDIPENELSEKVKEELNKLSDEEVQKIRMNEAKIAFMGTVAFAFVEQRAFEMSVSDPKTLQGKFRELRDKEPELMNGLIVALDKANVNYEPSRKIDDKVKDVVTEVYDNALEKVKSIKEANKQVESSLKITEIELDKLCKELKKNANEDDAKLIEDMRSLCGNIFNRLNVSIGLKGEKITKEDVDKEVNATVNKTVNGKNLITFAVTQGNKEAVEILVKSGAEMSGKTADYKRTPLQALKDGFKDFPKKLGQLFKKPERTLIDIAKITGNKEIESALQKAGEIQVKKDTAIDPILVDELEKTLQTSRRVVSDTPPNKPVPQLPESTTIHSIPESHQSKPLPIVPTSLGVKDQPDVSTPRPNDEKGLLMLLKGIKKNTTKEKSKTDPLNDKPFHLELDQMDKRLKEIENTYDFNAPELTGAKSVLTNEHKLLTDVKAELSKDPINKEQVIKVIEDGFKKFAEDSKYDPLRGLPGTTDLLLHDLRDKVELPKVGMKSGGK